MDNLLCDELLQEIFLRLPPPSAATVTLVSKRWLRLHRSSITSLSLSSPPLLSLPSFLSHFPFLSSLSLSSTTATSPSFLLSSPSLRRLSSLKISLSRPLSFHWLLHFPSLQHLSLTLSTPTPHSLSVSDSDSDSDAGISLTTLSISGIHHGDIAVGWLWRNCRKIRHLCLRSCEGIGDSVAFSEFLKCLNDLQEVEIRTCRSIVDGVLIKLAENCSSLNSLLVYDGGSRDGFLQFIHNSSCNLRKLDLRLPLDLDNNHLSAIGEKFRALSILRLESSCLVTGEGLMTLGVSMSNVLDELSLISCDVVEREPGLLATLGQNLRKLRKLELSFNELLVDKEFISMIVSCSFIVDLKLRGCRGLTNTSMVSIFKNCRFLESIDIMHCCGIEDVGVELLVLNSPRLRRVQVEDVKISGVARRWAARKIIEFVV